MIVRAFSEVGKYSLNCLQSVGRVVVFHYEFVASLIGSRLSLFELFKQLHMLGSKSLLIIICAAAFIGMVVAVQGFDTLVKLTSTLGTTTKQFSMSVLED